MEEIISGFQTCLSCAKIFSGCSQIQLLKHQDMCKKSKIKTQVFKKKDLQGESLTNQLQKLKNNLPVQKIKKNEQNLDSYCDGKLFTINLSNGLLVSLLNIFGRDLSNAFNFDSFISKFEMIVKNNQEIIEYCFSKNLLFASSSNCFFKNKEDFISSFNFLSILFNKNPCLKIFIEDAKRKTYISLVNLGIGDCNKSFSHEKSNKSVEIDLNDSEILAYNSVIDPSKYQLN